MKRIFPIIFVLYGICFCFQKIENINNMKAVNCCSESVSNIFIDAKLLQEGLSGGIGFAFTQNAFGAGIKIAKSANKHISISTVLACSVDLSNSITMQCAGVGVSFKIHGFKK